MRFDNRHAAIAVFAATMLTLGGCRPSAPGSSTDSAPATPSSSPPAATPGTAATSARTDSVVLRTDKSQYRAGEKVTLTFENRSASRYAFNPCTRTLEREENGAWTAMPDEGRMCTMEAWILDPRGTRTGATELPTPLAPGRYRVVVRMTIESPGATGSATAVNAVSDPITVS
jgi:hypothetical protein